VKCNPYKCKGKKIEATSKNIAKQCRSVVGPVTTGINIVSILYRLLAGLGRKLEMGYSSSCGFISPSTSPLSHMVFHQSGI
jgi:hypothetical protein